MCALGKMLNAFPSLSSFHITGYLLASPKVRKKKKATTSVKLTPLISALKGGGRELSWNTERGGVVTAMGGSGR